MDHVKIGQGMMEVVEKKSAGDVYTYDTTTSGAVRQTASCVQRGWSDVVACVWDKESRGRSVKWELSLRNVFGSKKRNTSKS